jgi:predicted CopG family antitoxin
MAKQIMISEEVYSELLRRRKSSFSEAIKDLIKEEIKTSGDRFIEKYAGIMPDFDEKDFLKKLKKGWSKWKIPSA